jgi:hypothetical protein
LNKNKFENIGILFSMPLDYGIDDVSDTRAGTAQTQRLQPHEVSIEEYNELAKRLDTMEGSVGFVLTKV